MRRNVSMSDHQNYSLNGNSRIEFREKMSVFLFQCAVFLSIFGLASGDQSTTQENFMRQITWTLFGLFAFINIFNDYLSTRKLNYSFGGIGIWSIVLYAIFSAAWSTDSFATIKRSILLLIVLLLTISCFGKKQKNDTALDRVLMLPLIILCALSVLFTLVAPGVAITDIGWRGATSHKNEIGQVIVVALLLVIFGVSRKGTGFIKRVLAISMLIVGLLFSKSSTSLVAVGVAIALTYGISLVLLIRQDVKWTKPFLIIALPSLVVIHIAFLTDKLPAFDQISGFLLASLGKSSTLTGRTELWDLVLSQSLYHNPLLGGGYGGFWNGPFSVAAYTTFRNGIYLGQAHNGYIDIYNDMGWVGLALVAVVIIGLVFNIIKLMKRGHSEWKLVFSILIVTLIFNYAESTLMRTTQFLNIIFFASVIYSQRACVRDET